jgi:predicted alpha/beta-hydrolase family hydrolase
MVEPTSTPSLLEPFGPEHSSHFVVFAPGDQGRLSDSAPSAIAAGLAKAGIHGIRFAFPPCDGKDGALRDALLAERIREAASLRAPSERLVLAGLSRGARVSAALAAELGAVGLVGFGYPFHARNNPDPDGRVEALAALPVPALIFQGTRDSHGNQEQIKGYNLPAHIRMHWLVDANHALHPRVRSGHTQAAQLAKAADVAATFIRNLI